MPKVFKLKDYIKWAKMLGQECPLKGTTNFINTERSDTITLGNLGISNFRHFH